MRSPRALAFTIGSLLAVVVALVVATAVAIGAIGDRAHEDDEDEVLEWPLATDPSEPEPLLATDEERARIGSLVRARLEPLGDAGFEALGEAALSVHEAIERRRLARRALGPIGAPIGELVTFVPSPEPALGEAALSWQGRALLASGRHELLTWRGADTDARPTLPPPDSGRRWERAFVLGPSAVVAVQPLRDPLELRELRADGDELVVRGRAELLAEATLRGEPSLRRIDDALFVGAVWPVAGAPEGHAARAARVMAYRHVPGDAARADHTAPPWTPLPAHGAVLAPIQPALRPDLRTLIRCAFEDDAIACRGVALVVPATELATLGDHGLVVWARADASIDGRGGAVLYRVSRALEVGAARVAGVPIDEHAQAVSDAGVVALVARAEGGGPRSSARGLGLAVLRIPAEALGDDAATLPAPALEPLDLPPGATDPRCTAAAARLVCAFALGDDASEVRAFDVTRSGSSPAPRAIDHPVDALVALPGLVALLGRTGRDAHTTYVRPGDLAIVAHDVARIADELALLPDLHLLGEERRPDGSVERPLVRTWRSAPDRWTARVQRLRDDGLAGASSDDVELCARPCAWDDVTPLQHDGRTWLVARAPGVVDLLELALEADTATLLRTDRVYDAE